MMRLVMNPHDDIISKINNMMIFEKGIKEIFSDKTDKLLNSVVSALIFIDEKQIGFINVFSENLDNILFVDAAIIEEYRGNGYIKEALKLLISEIKFDKFLLCETTNVNCQAMNSLRYIGQLVYTNGNRKFYLFPKTCATEFYESEAFRELHNYVVEQKIKRLVK